MPRLVDRKIQLVADAAAACRIRLDRSELRDVTGEIEWSKVTQTVPADYPAAAAKAGRDAPRDPAEIAQLYAAYEELKRDRAVIDFEDVLLLTVGILQDRHDIADQVRAQYQHFVVDEYQDVSPLQQRLLELWLGERDRPVRRRRRQPDDLLLHRRHPRPPARLPHPPPRRHRRQAGPRLPLHPPGRPPRQRPARPGPRPRRRPPPGAGLPARRRAPSPVYTEYADEPAEAEGAARRIRDLIAAGRPGRARSPSCSAPTPSPRSTNRPSPTPGCPTSCAAPSGSSTAPRCARRASPCAARPASAATTPCWTTPSTCPRRCAPCSSGEGWTREPPAGSGAVRERWESLAALVRLAEDFAAGQARRRPSPTSWPSSTSGPAPSTPRPSRASPSPPCTRPRAWSGTPCSWSALAEGMMPITYAKTDEQIEEERRLLYVGVTRAREHLSAVLGAVPLARRPRRAAGPAASSTGCAPAPAGAAAARRRGGAAASSAVRGAAARPPQTRAADPGPLPGLRAHADRRGRDEADALRGLPLRHGRGRSTSGCASGARTRRRQRASPPSASSPTRR